VVKKLFDKKYLASKVLLLDVSWELFSSSDEPRIMAVLYSFPKRGMKDDVNKIDTIMMEIKGMASIRIIK